MTEVAGIRTSHTSASTIIRVLCIVTPSHFPTAPEDERMALLFDVIYLLARVCTMYLVIVPTVEGQTNHPRARLHRPRRHCVYSSTGTRVGSGDPFSCFALIAELFVAVDYYFALIGIVCRARDLSAFITIIVWMGPSYYVR